MRTLLRLQAKNWEFGALCEELIRDRIVVGIRDDAVRSRLLRETTLDLQKTIDICRAAEQSKSHLDAIKSEALLQGVQAVKKIVGRSKRTERQQDKQTKSGKIMVDCKYCGLSHEKDKAKCPSFGRTCSSCGKKNHCAKLCNSRSNSDRRQAHVVETGDLYIGSIEKERNVDAVSSTDEEWYVSVEIQQQNVKFKLDTCARCNVLPKHSSSQLMKTNTRLVSYSGNVMQVEGEVMLDTLYKWQKYPVQFYVVGQRATQAILGLKSCEQLNLIYRVEEICKRVYLTSTKIYSRLQASGVFP